MTKLRFGGTAAQVHPATGLELRPGVSDYPDDQAEALVSQAGLERVEDAIEAAPEPATQAPAEAERRARGRRESAEP